MVLAIFHFFFSFNKLSSVLRYSLLLFLSTVLLSACGGGGGGSDGNAVVGGNGNEGQVVIGLTDAEGDFDSYIVDVLSLTLTHQNGAVVETLPLSARVDFAEYTELTEFLTAATVPSGIYTHATLLVDFSNADIMVEDSTGEPVAAVAVDSNGDPLGQVSLDVELSSSDTFRIAPGIPAHITLDFDLAASNEVSFATTPPQVTVRPVLIADTLLEDPKPHRLRGLLNEVAVDQNVFSIYIRPFYRHVGDFGSIRVHVDYETVYDIDQVGYVGTPGLEALSQLPERAPVIAVGTLDRDDHQFNATEVLAGTSVPWGEHDYLHGNVVARDGDTLTVSAARRIRDDNHISFHRLVTVEIGPDTRVVKQAYPTDTVDKDSISVGQRISVVGQFADSSDVPVLDATEGGVRMLLTQLNGTVAAPGPLAVDLQAIDHRRASVFDFSGTGASGTTDADPDYYEIDTGTLSLTGIDFDDPIKVIGHVRPFGSAPEDFQAQTIIELSNLPAKMLINWQGAGTTAPFSSISSTAIVVDLSNVELGNFHTVYQAGVATDLTTLGMDPTLVPNSSGNGVFTLAYNGRTRQFIQFARFSEALSDLLDGTHTLEGLHASGNFDAASATLTLRGMVVRIR